MAFSHLKQWIGKRASLVAGGLFIISLILYAVSYLIERGFTALSFGTIMAAVATALLLASVSVTIEQYIKAKLTDQEIDTIQTCREFGLQDVQERTLSRGQFAGLPDLLDECRKEVLILAYAADNFIEQKMEWIIESLGRGINVGLLILHPKSLEQAEQTEERKFSAQTQKTLENCKLLIKKNTPGIENFKVRGYKGHLYFTGIFIDRCIIESPKKSIRPGRICIQLKANFKTQHKGILLTFTPKSRYAKYYTESCRDIWTKSEDLIKISKSNKAT